MEYGLIGKHLGHSFSKEIHENIAGYLYELKELNENDLSTFFLEKNFKAINVTIPYKEKVIPYLDEIDNDAKNVGAVNTIVNKNGRLIGYNTDVYGFISLIKHMKLDIKNKNVLILGDGGASKAIKVALEKLEAKNIYIASRKDNELTIKYEDIYKLNDINVIINATPVGMYPNNNESLNIDINRFKNLVGVVDVIYNPLRTSLVISSKEEGIKSEGGLYMLVAQAYKAIEIFLDKKLDKKILKETYQKILNEKSNIVLIGMPSSGKSLIARKLSKKLNIPVLEMDEEIKKRIDMSIESYFRKYGETSFRELEHQIILEHYQKTPLIISTGGGVVLRKDNMNLLRQNGVIFYLDRDINNLKLSKDRPLAKSKEDYIKLYESRKDLYLKYQDYIINNNKTPNRAVNEIIKRRKV